MIFACKIALIGKQGKLKIDIQYLMEEIQDLFEIF